MTLNIDSKALISSLQLDQRNDVQVFRTHASGSLQAGNFSKILTSAQQQFRVNTSTLSTLSQVTVKPGDTLSNIVKNFYAERGLQVSQSEVLRQAQDIAKASGIPNPDRIFRDSG